MLSYIVIAVAYGIFCACFVYEFAVHKISASLSPLELMILSSAVFRCAEILGESRVLAFLRAPFTEIVTSSSPCGCSEDEVPEGQGLQRVIGELLRCPFCETVWWATILTFAWLGFPAVRPVITALAVSGFGLGILIFVKLLDKTRKAL